jgi:hypothetical protein
MASPTDLRNLPDPRGLFELIEVIGTGTYGEVHKGRHKKTGQIAAVKILDLIEDEEEEIKVEVDVLKLHSTHENITSFYGIYGVETPGPADNKLWLVRCAFDSHSRMPLIPTPVRLKRYPACDQWHSSRVFTPLTGWHCKLRPNTAGNGVLWGRVGDRFGEEDVTEAVARASLCVFVEPNAGGTYLLACQWHRSS